MDNASLLADVLRLPVEERIEIYQRLGESLEGEHTFFEIPPEHAKILDERLAADRDDSPGVLWSEVKQEMLGALKRIK